MTKSERRNCHLPDDSRPKQFFSLSLGARELARFKSFHIGELIEILVKGSRPDAPRDGFRGEERVRKIHLLCLESCQSVQEAVLVVRDDAGRSDEPPEVIHHLRSLKLVHPGQDIHRLCNHPRANDELAFPVFGRGKEVAGLCRLTFVVPGKEPDEDVGIEDEPGFHGFDERRAMSSRARFRSSLDERIR